MDQEVSKFESYSKAFAEKAGNSFFSSHDAVTAENLLSVTSIDQVNLFVAKNLFQRWKEEIQKLKSPYFNYDSEPVKKGLSEFMNVLSRNIMVRREFFKPLLEKAALDSLLLLMKPENYFKSEFSGKRVAIGEVKDIAKYFRIHKSFWPSFISGCESKNMNEVSGEEIISAFGAYLSYSPVSAEEKQSYMNSFSSVLPFEISPEPAAPLPIFAEQPKQEAVSQDVPKQQEAPKKEHAVQFSGTKTLNEMFSANQLTINDLLKKNSSGSVVERLGKSKIENIRGAISLSQKFMFINSLFGGVMGNYDAALNEVERCASYAEALHLLNNNYGQQFNWDFNSPEVQEFVELVERRFA